MKIYDFVGAPNPKRLRIYLAEKGIDLERVQVSIPDGEHRSEWFREKNPLAALPVLELDDGTCISESLAIIEYLEELHPEPAMIGTTPEERLRTRELDRICELGVLFNVARVLWHTHPVFAKSVIQSSEEAENGRTKLASVLDVLDARIGEGPFVAGERVTIADCTLYAALWFAHVLELELEIDLSERRNIARWSRAFRDRPSARA